MHLVIHSLVPPYHLQYGKMEGEAWGHLSCQCLYLQLKECEQVTVLVYETPVLGETVQEKLLD